MAETTAIEWTHRPHPLTGKIIEGATLNFWIGCTEAGPECAGCYAKGLDNKRFSKIPSMGGGTNEAPVSHWGKGAPRHYTKTWKDAFRWNKAALANGIPTAVFTNSLADFFDREVPDERRDAAYEVIEACTNLDWLILTKRPDKAAEYLAARPHLAGLGHVWIGTTIGAVKSLERLEQLLTVPARLRFLSMEPLLEDVARDPRMEAALASGEIGWVIAGGESEMAEHPHKARPMHPDWPTNLQALCWAYGVPFFFKQWGEWAPAYELDHNPQLQAMCVMGNVEMHRFPTGGEGGRRVAFKVGKHRSGNLLNGKKYAGLPPIRRLTA